MFDINKLFQGGSAKVEHGGFTGIKFEGFLVSTDNEGEPFYFTVDPISGNALMGFRPRTGLESLRFNIVDEESTSKQPTQKELPDLVEVIRYFRPVTDEGYTHNLGGMTAICELDYKDMLITVYPSFCMPCDNFDKTLGLYYARDNQKNNLGFTVKMDRALSIQENIYYGLAMDIVSFENEESFRAFRAPLNRALKDYLG